MNEQLLQYIWHRKILLNKQLVTTDNEVITIIHQGVLNNNAGPDFLHAKILIGNTQWIGNIEVHIRTSDWLKHKHQNDANYQNIILHIVYDNDIQLDCINCPTLELKNYIDQNFLNKYQELLNSLLVIPCQHKILSIPSLIWTSWIERLFISRIERKTNNWKQTLDINKNNWQQLLYERIAYNFGFHVNSEAFLLLAQQTPLKILALHKDNLFQIEALLFGQAGLLERNNADEYMLSLEKEYHFLRRKYELHPINGIIWKFMRMRPVNFPTIRIAQFAMLIHKSHQLFQKFLEVYNPQELLPLLDIATSSYWEAHYRFSEISKIKSIKHLGKDAIFNIYINTIIPIQYLYYSSQKSNAQFEFDIASIFNAAQQLKPESNKIINLWKSIGIKAENAMEAQALLELFNEYCSNKRCLECAIGNKILSK